MKRIVARGVAAGMFRPDVVINNVGEPDRGVRKLLDTVHANGILAG